MTAWLDFIVCALMGWTGIHKFKERKVAIGTLYFLTVGLCGAGWIVDTIRYLVIAVKRTVEIHRARSRRLEMEAELPVIDAPELLELNGSEICHYEQNAACISSTSVGKDCRGAITVRTGPGMPPVLEPKAMARINWRKTEELLGRLYVTDRRVVITDGQATAEYSVGKITKIRLYRNLILLLTGERTFYLATDEAVYVYQIIARIAGGQKE